VKLSINKISKPGTHPESQRADLAASVKKKSLRVTGVSRLIDIKGIIPFVEEVEFHMNVY